MNEITKHFDYVRPPIVEAVIGLIVDPQWAMDDIEKSSKKLLKNYNKKQDEIMIQAAFSLQNGKGVTSSDGKKNGIRLTSLDQSEILLIHQHEFLVGQLAPYPGWNTLFDRARRDYLDFRREAPHRQIKRVGVRFMNRLDIPVAKFPDFVPSEFCTFIPQRPPFGQERLKSYTLQVCNNLERDNCKAQVTTTALASPVPDMESILLDIDVFCEDLVPEEEPAVWDLISRMREYKNEIFENCITDRARSIFNEPQ